MNLGHALVTGAAGAIGAAIARALRQRWPGVQLALLDREAPAALAAELGRAATHAVDLRDGDALPAALARIVDAGGPLDGLVNCAGVMRVRHVATWDWRDARDLLAVDLLAPLQLQHLVAPGMVARGGGAIVNISSIAGKIPLRGCTYYGAAKAGLALASEVARADLAPHGVRVVTVYPGPVRSALEAGARADYGGGGLFGRFAPVGEPAELASLIVRAIDRGEPRVIYPRIYGVGQLANHLAAWFALGYGPPPVA